MPLPAAQRRSLTWGAVAALAALLLWLLAPVLTPFIVAAVLAYALHPLVEMLAARRWPRLAAVVLVEVVAIVALLALVLLLVPVIAKELPLLREQIPLLADRLNGALSPWLAQYGIQVALDSASIKAFVLKYLNANLEDGLAAALSSARIGGSIVLAVIGNLILVPVVLFYLLDDWPQLRRYAADNAALTPPAAGESRVVFLGDSITDAWDNPQYGGFFRASRTSTAASAARRRRRWSCGCAPMSSR